MMNGDSSRWESSVDICVIGNPENRRVFEFLATAERTELARTTCIGWLELLDDPSAMSRLGQFDLVRLESPGENQEVHQRLVGLAGVGNAKFGNAQLEFGEIRHLRESHCGFVKVLNRLAACREVKFQNAPTDIQVMFDKWKSHERFQAAGLGRPNSQLAPNGLREFREFRHAFRTRHASDSGRLFLKPRYGSSASGVCAYRWSGDREQLIAPIEIDRSSGGARLYNSLRIRRFTTFADIGSILDTLLPQDMICEQWIPKAKLPGGRFDLRIVVVAGESRHCVVRQSKHPMTNLHLGNQRGNIDQVVDQFGKDVVASCRKLAELAAKCFSASLYAGVDIILDSCGTPYVCEINAFGDLLPNVLHRGEGTYESILRASTLSVTAN